MKHCWHVIGVEPLAAAFENYEPTHGSRIVKCCWCGAGGEWYWKLVTEPASKEAHGHHLTKAERRWGLVVPVEPATEACTWINDDYEAPDEIIHIDNEGVVRKSTVLRDPEPECTGRVEPDFTVDPNDPTHPGWKA